MDEFLCVTKETINATAISYNGDVGNNVITFVTKSFNYRQLVIVVI